MSEKYKLTKEECLKIGGHCYEKPNIIVTEKVDDFIKKVNDLVREYGFFDDFTDEHTMVFLLQKKGNNIIDVHTISKLGFEDAKHVLKTVVKEYE